MTYGERVLQSYAEQIEIKYLRAIRRGWTDPAVIVDMKDQENRRQAVAQQQGISAAEVTSLVGLVLSGDRQTLAQKLDGRFPGNRAAKALSSETPPPGHFPVLIVTDADQEPGKVGVHFFYRPSPEIPSDGPPTANLHDGQVTEVTLRNEPTQQVEFAVNGLDVRLIAGPQWLFTLKPGDRVYVAYRLDESGHGTVLDLLHGDPTARFSEPDKVAFRKRLGEALFTDDVEADF